MKVAPGLLRSFRFEAAFADRSVDVDKQLKAATLTSNNNQAHVTLPQP